MRVAGEALLAARLLRERAPLFGAIAAAELLATLAAALTWGGDDALDVAGLGLGFSATVLVLVGVHGGLAAERRSGLWLLWVQKPVSPVLHYLVRWAVASALTVAAILVLAGATSLLAEAFQAGAGALVLRQLPAVLLLCLTLSALVFAVSGWGCHPDALVALVLLFVSLPLAAASHRMSPLVQDGLAVLLFPWDATVGVGEALREGRLDRDALAGALVTLRTAGVWVSIGLAGIAWRCRRPPPRSTA